jgi:amino acid adenylation domain-containing protein
MSNDIVDADAAFGKRKTEGAPAASQLTATHPGQRTTPGQYAEEVFVVPAALAESLTSVGREVGAAPDAALLAAWQLLLSRYSVQQEITVGMVGASGGEPNSCRGDVSAPQSFRIELDEEESFLVLVARAREVLRQAREGVPLEGPAERPQAETDAGDHPPLQVLFVAAEDAAARTEAAAGSDGRAERCAAGLSLSLTCGATADGAVRCALDYDTALFDAAAAKRMVGHLKNLLRAAAAAPLRPAAELPMMSEEERDTILFAWNAAAAGDSRPVGDYFIHRQIEAQARRTPDALAVTFEREGVTYAELERRANKLANYLVELGVKPDTPVAICVERSVEMIVGILAILKAGGGYVPLDPTYPEERLAYILGDTRSPLVLTQRRFETLFQGATARAVCLDAELVEIEKSGEEAPRVDVEPGGLAYVIYTSGSTGKPKGVMISHEATCNHMLWIKGLCRLTAADRLLQKTVYTFDASVWEILTPLMAGATLIAARPGGHQDSRYIAETIASEGVTILQLVPTMLSMLIDEEAWGRCDSLRLVFCGGEALSAELRERFFRRSKAELYNLYGPTEASIDATYWRCERDYPYACSPIGRPVDNMQSYVLDHRLRPVPVGVPGELHIAGVGLARGYLNRPGLTAEKFIPNPFSAEPGGCMYKSGDRARYLPDGQIEYLGRLDHQVKIRGFRVELGEIEVELRRHPQLRECVAVVREDAPGDKRLVAYLVNEPGADPSFRELRAWLGARLPKYMVPAAFVTLDRLPLTANGKVNRRALPAPDPSRLEPDDSYVAPRTPAERALAAIWGEVLHVEGVGVHDDFFELGGHSLLVTQVISRLRGEMRVEVPMRTFFERPTVAELARFVEEAAGACGEDTPPITPAPRDRELPLAFSQERVWFISRLNPDNLAYNFQSTFRFDGPLDADALGRALTEVVRRHEVWRTSFPEMDGRPVQVVHEARPVELPLEDLTDVAEGEREAELARRVAEELTKRFDLKRTPLVRWVLYRLGEREHVLLHVEHHIIHDGWAWNVFLHELFELYKAYSAGLPSPLPEPSLQFADFAAWQRRWMEGGEAARQLAFWREQLGGAPTLLKLPLDGPRPPVQTFRGAAPRVELPLPLCRAIRQSARRQRATLFMTMYAAFVTLLHRFSGETDICVGSGIANRRWKETERLMGMLVNNIVLRNDLSGDPKFSELLEQVREVTLRAYANQDVPFDRVVEAVRPQRDLSHNPLFQVMFSFHDSPLPDIVLPGTSVSMTGGISNKSAKCDMNIVVVPRYEDHLEPGGNRDEGITIIWEYNTDLFDEATILRLVNCYERLLEAAVAEPEARVSSLPLLDEEEQRRLLAEWGGGTRSYAPGQTLHSLFEQQAEKSPQAVALVCGDERVTYGELEARANRLARRLCGLGVGPETPVSVCLERSAELVVALLGVLKAGGAYVPLDPAYPPERLAWLLEDARSPVLITHSRMLERLPTHSARVLLIDAEAEGPARESEERPEAAATPGSLAYVIYTSGSTGKPKGTLVSHYTVVRLFQATRHWFDFSERDVWTLFHSYAFDFSVWEMWGALLHGGRLVVVPYDVSRSPAAFYRMLSAERVTVLNQTPSAFRQLIQAEEEAGASPELNLRLVIFGGEALELKSLKPWFGRHGDARPQLVNMYGITETTVHVTYRPLREGDLAEAPGSVIGGPIHDLQVYILDRHMRPAPVGVPGEMYIGGAGLARGYLNRPALTAERFVPHSFDSAPGGRLYRTGDLARYLPGGDIEYLGRSDHQVKIRGFRIELGEVQAAVEQHPSVRESVAVVGETAEGDKRLVVYYVASGDVDAARLRAFLKERLPEYMMPQAFVSLEALPLTPNGKLDRKALPPPDAAHAPAAHDAGGEPRTAVEEIVADIWGQVLGVERVGLRDDFFELGGHSLLATRVLSRMREALGVEVSVRAIFENPTVEGLSEVAEAELRGGARAEEVPLVRVSSDEPPPCSFAQRRLWFLDRLTPGKASYNVPLAYHLSGPLDTEALWRSLSELVRRHEALRTTFEAHGGEPVQIIHEAVELEPNVTDLSSLPEHERERRAEELAREEAIRPFDLCGGPLFRALLLRLSPSRHALLLTLHHIATDGWSLTLLTRELSALYGARLRGEAPPLEDPPVAYSDYARWQRRVLDDPALERQLSYWRERLTGASTELELPADRPRPPLPSSRGSALRWRLDAEVWQRLRSLCRSESVTPFMALLSAYAVLLGRYSGSNDLLIGAPVAGRPRPELEQVVGFFANTLVLRARLAGDPTFRELLGRVRETCIGAYAHQDVPFERIVEELAPERGLSRHPLFQVTFSLQNGSRKPPELEGLTVTTLNVGLQTAKFDLNFDVVVDENGAEAWFVYNLDIFNEETIERMRRHFEQLLDSILARPQARLDELQMLLDEEKSLLERGGGIEDFEGSFSL